MNDIETIEEFYGVYLLYCLNPRYLGRTYIGFTVDPNRRIKQHNKGKKFGGAWKTSGKEPWKMILIIHGFPNDISALRFEWAWQHPQLSRRLKHISRKKSQEKILDYNLRLLFKMLQTEPWNRLPLKIRWLEDEFSRQFPADAIPPTHMPLCFGPVVTKKNMKNDTLTSKCDDTNNIPQKCYICNKDIYTKKEVSCLTLDCDMVSHIICLSKLFLSVGEYIPVEGSCPKCHNNYLWGDIIRQFKGCDQNVDTCGADLENSIDKE